MSRAARAVAPFLARVLAGILLVAWAASPAHAQEVIEYYGTDALGSIRVVFDASGTVVGRTDYLPFGETFEASGNGPAEGFTGQARDGEAGLDYFHARMYQPRTGRFNAVDTVYAGSFDPQQWNRYSYARENPLRFIDVWGKEVCDASDGAKWCPPLLAPNPFDVESAAAPTFAPNVPSASPNDWGYQGGELDGAEHLFDLMRQNDFGFQSLDNAAFAALEYIFGDTIATGWEWGGLLYERPDERFSFTPPFSSFFPDYLDFTGVDVPCCNNRLAGKYHSHPPPHGYIGNSAPEISWSKWTGKPSYVVDPAGKVFKYHKGVQSTLPKHIPLPSGYVPPPIEYGDQ